MVTYGKPYERHETFNLLAPWFPESAFSLSSMACKKHHPFLYSLQPVEKYEMLLGCFILKVIAIKRGHFSFLIDTCTLFGVRVSRSGEYNRNPPRSRKECFDPNSEEIE